MFIIYEKKIMLSGKKILQKMITGKADNNIAKKTFPDNYFRITITTRVLKKKHKFQKNISLNINKYEYFNTINRFKDDVISTT